MASEVATSAVPQLPQSATVFRVRRKRTADPHEALIVSIKRSRLDGFSSSDTVTPLLYHLATTSENPVISSVDCSKLPSNTPLNIIDFKPSATTSNVDQQMETESADREGENPLAVLNNAVGEFGNADATGHSRCSRYTTEQITLNGTPLVTVENATASEYVFDFYWNDIGIQYPIDDLEIRMANREEIELYTGGATESSENPDDEDDSNSENNWRNDYPDEESQDDSEDDSDKEYYDEEDLERCFDSFNCSDPESESEY